MDRAASPPTSPAPRAPSAAAREPLASASTSRDAPPPPGSLMRSAPPRGRSPSHAPPDPRPAPSAPWLRRRASHPRLELVDLQLDQLFAFRNAAIRSSRAPPVLRGDHPVPRGAGHAPLALLQLRLGRRERGSTRIERRRLSHKLLLELHLPARDLDLLAERRTQLLLARQRCAAARPGGCSARGPLLGVIAAAAIASPGEPVLRPVGRPLPRASP